MYYILCSTLMEQKYIQTIEELVFAFCHLYPVFLYLMQ